MAKQEYIMLAVERKNKILEIIQEEKSVTVSKLSKVFKITEETIRRDLKALEDEGHLTRTYGGAFIDTGVQNDINVSVREAYFVENKHRMAAVCKDFIHNGDSIFLDCSTTVFHLCDFIENMRITVLTNSLKVLTRLADRENINLISTGGVFSPSSYGYVGRSATQVLSLYYVDKAFISCRSVDISQGLTHSGEQQADIYNLILNRSEKAYLVCDHTKIDKVSFMHVGDLTKIAALVTDEPLPQAWEEYLTQKGIEYYRAAE
jgi:DeoR/GlpR family transcriptional regulator of sugar metabolism